MVFSANHGLKPEVSHTCTANAVPELGNRRRKNPLAKALTPFSFINCVTNPKAWKTINRFFLNDNCDRRYH